MSEAYPSTARSRVNLVCISNHHRCFCCYHVMSIIVLCLCLLNFLLLFLYVLVFWSFLSTDESPVDLLFCPDSIVVETSEQEMNVTWPQPQFRGEGSEGVKITSNVNRTWMVLRPGAYSIEYTAVNELNGQEAVCRFNITVKGMCACKAQCVCVCLFTC